MTKEEAAVREVVKEFLSGYEQRQVESCMSVMTHSRPLLFLGTNADEVWKTPEDLRAAFDRDFRTMTNIRWGDYRHFAIEASATLASVLIELPVSFQVGEKQEQTLFRFALTLHKELEQWKISLAMGSVPHKAGTITFS
ncbi:MAG TPA: nuclear transport factor 2 family protein [Nitrospira sp.]|nr:nuclear transport factor 2 family protein [Nitrospira sp.]